MGTLNGYCEARSQQPWSDPTGWTIAGGLTSIIRRCRMAVATARARIWRAVSAVPEAVMRKILLVATLTGSVSYIRRGTAPSGTPSSPQTFTFIW